MGETRRQRAQQQVPERGEVHGAAFLERRQYRRLPPHGLKGVYSSAVD
jgi:hypothetical protein